MGEVPVVYVPSQRTGGVRDPAHQDATGRERRVIERLENLGLGEVLEQVGVVIAA
jgi:hypothetical protein